MLKVYNCDVAGSSIANLLAPGLRLRCNTTPIATAGAVRLGLDGGGPLVDVGAFATANPDAPNAAGGFCQLEFATRNEFVQPVSCLSWGCLFEAGNPRIECVRTTCDCLVPEGCPPAVELVLPNIDGAGTVACNEATGLCQVDIEGLPIKVDVPCSASECVAGAPASGGGAASGAASAVQEDAAFASREADYSDVILAGIPLYIVVGLTALVLLLVVPRVLGVLRAMRGVDNAARRGDSSGIAALSWGAAEGGAPTVLYFDRISLRPAGKLSSFGRRAKGRPQTPGKSQHRRVESSGTEAPFSGGSGTDAGAEIAKEAAAASPRAVPSDRTTVPVSVRAASPRSGASRGLSGGRFAVTVNESFQNGGRPRPGPVAEGNEWLDDEPNLAFAAPARRRGGDDVKALPTRRSAILDAVSGEARAGELLGVLGPSGSGKSSFLALLASQHALLPRGCAATGRVAVERASGAHHAPATVGFVQQHDCLVPTLTVKESVLLAVMLRRRVTGAAVDEAAALVATLLCELSLTECAGRMVGGTAAVRGISGGERRRVSIAQELALRPHVLLLDEVTSGLDSFNAHRLVTTLRDIAAQPSAQRILVLSLHQPSAEIYSMLQRVLLLASGTAVYSGAAANVAPWLQGVGVPPPPGVPVADYLLRLVNDPKKMALVTAQAQASAIKGSGADSLPRKLEADGLRMGGHRVPPLYRLGILIWRALLDVGRPVTALVLAWVVTVAAGAFCGLVFWSLGEGIAGVQNRAGVIFFALTFMAFTSITSIDSLLHERDVMRKEVALGYYPAWMYLAARTLLDALLLRAGPAIAFGAPLYHMAGLAGGSTRFALFCFVLAVFTIAIQAQAMIIVEVTRRASTAMLLFVLLIILYMLFSGFLVNGDSVHDAVAWIQKASIFFYSFEALAVNEFQGSFFDFNIEGIGAADNVDGELIAETLGIDMDNLRRDVILVVSLMGGSVLFLLIVPLLRRIGLSLR